MLRVGRNIVARTLGSDSGPQRDIISLSFVALIRSEAEGDTAVICEDLSVMERLTARTMNEPAAAEFGASPDEPYHATAKFLFEKVKPRTRHRADFN